MGVTTVVLIDHVAGYVGFLATNLELAAEVSASNYVEQPKLGPLHDVIVECPLLGDLYTHYGRWFPILLT